MKAFTVTIVVLVPDYADAHLQSEQSIADEIRSWIQSLDGRVRALTVRQAPEGGQR